MQIRILLSPQHWKSDMYSYSYHSELHSQPRTTMENIHSYRYTSTHLSNIKYNTYPHIQVIPAHNVNFIGNAYRSIRNSTTFAISISKTRQNVITYTLSIPLLKLLSIIHKKMESAHSRPIPLFQYIFSLQGFRH